jgi:hypothetical protein
MQSEKPRRKFAWMIWLAFALFAGFLFVSLSRSLQPRMDGMPISGGTMTTNEESSTTTNSDNSMPGMNMGK